MSKLKCYAAGPFFNPLQLASMQEIEGVLEVFDGLDIFKPRDGAASARKLNVMIGAGKDPSADVRRAVFADNINNIDSADFVVALVDDRDVGTIFEMGYACRAGVPVISYTAKGYGMNLMLAESVLAHCKGAQQLHDAVALFLEQVRTTGIIDMSVFEQRFKRANLSEGVEADRNMELYSSKNDK